MESKLKYIYLRFLHSFFSKAKAASSGIPSPAKPRQLHQVYVVKLPCFAEEGITDETAITDEAEIACGKILFEMVCGSSRVRLISIFSVLTVL